MALKELPKGVIPVLVERNGVFTPYFSTDFKLKEGDGLVVLGDPTKFTGIRELCSAGGGPA
jgi:Trk K+ transport system NAD-binding subunit